MILQSLVSQKMMPSFQFNHESLEIPWISHPTFFKSTSFAAASPPPAAAAPAPVSVEMMNVRVMEFKIFQKMKNR